MSVVTKNPFALLNEDGDSAPAETVATPAAAAAPAAEAPRSTRGRGAAQSGAPSRSGRYYKRGGAPVVSTPDADGFTPANPNEAGLKFDNKGERGRGGRGRGRGGRGRGDGDRPPRGRAYDKKSQTDHVDTEKTVNQGWGAETGNAEVAAETNGAADALQEASADSGWGAPAGDDAGWGAPTPDAAGWDAPADGAAAPAPNGETPAAETNGDAAKDDARRKRREEEEEEDNTMTLEEYLKKKKADEADALPKLEGPRAIDADFKDVKPLVREDAEYFAGKSKTSVPKTKAKKEEKQYIVVDAPFERPARGGERGGRGRGGRGGERGGRGRGGDRGGRGRGGPRENWGNGNARNGNSAAQVDVDDESAFPSLS